MREARRVVAAALFGVLLSSARTMETQAKTPTIPELRQAMEKLRLLHRKMAPPKPWEWLSEHREPGQTFEEYLKSNPVIPAANRRTIYIQPLGDFRAKQREVISLTAEYIGIYFNLPVKTLEDMRLSTLPDEARRVHPEWGDRQVLTTYVLDKVLRPRLPKDAFGFISFTSSDLWPGAGWNFVFGQASLRDRVGVWSLYRFGDPAASDEAFRLCLRRTVALGTHELGHMFSILHCTAYECNMCGSNSLPESDRRPIADCPECMAKICWATGADPCERYEKLAKFCGDHGLKDEAERYAELAKALR
jgi:archaemetzincin